jgi:short-subunit dehydrogenase
VQVQAIDADLAQETSLEAIDAATVDLEVGLLVASAGSAAPAPSWRPTSPAIPRC